MEEEERRRKELERYRKLWWATLFIMPLIYFILTLIFQD